MAKVPKDIGQGGSYISSDLAAILLGIADDLASLKAQIGDVQSKYNQHINDGKHRVATVADAAALNSTVNSTITTTK
ncbi:hypothetical protein [Bacillus mycoides]|uniref:hypothetical protein n=1 Tax=Bacillus mycoides TaxID=1405 RepID=UPI000BEFFB3A|nr:hypothetical protein [Bacillus mycoides]PEK91473.1 hypothetical protein CN600_21460 [Bacillus mycoides]